MLKRAENFHEVLKKINAEWGQVESKLGGLYIKLFVKDELEHRKLTKYLKMSDLEYFTMTPRSERPIKVVIRGISPETPADYVKKSLIEEYKFEIEKVAQLTKFKTKRPLPIYQITLKNNEANKGIWNSNTLMLVKVTVCKFERKSGTIQCFNCNQWHHSAAGCGYKPRCIKCGGPHAKDQCTEQPKDVPICINCKKEGHVASYKGCEMYPKPKDRRTRFPNPRKLDPAISYADMANKRINQTKPTEIQETNAPKINQSLKFMISSLFCKNLKDCLKIQILPSRLTL
ncbi:hypothetical protein AVEN_112606-1 [Araneus ventricosus]|uniref:Nucleic-acid-binding protein from transposon X-element n=1 Tax=Araneus ventricosus TaxID=182803 RepID=A0A4Y2MFG8_ARAVE|nr:hypothetical protein AVEN_112606-1 [Araneus ventricosus]